MAPLRFVEETQTETGAWAASSAGISTDLLRNGVITEIRATVELTPSATLAGANQPDGLWRVIQNLSIVGGSQTYMTLPSKTEPVGGTLLHYLNRFDGYGLGHPIGVITAPQRSFTPINFVLHCGTRNRNRFGHLYPEDLSGFIPTSPESRLRALWVTGANTVMDDTVTITSGVLRLDVKSWLGSEQEIMGEMRAQGVMLPPGAKCMVPQWSAEIYSHTATFSDYSAERNVPTGGYLRRIIIVEQDDTTTGGRGLRAGDQVTGVAVKLSKDGTHLKRVTVEQMLSDFPPANVVEADDAALDFGGFTANGIFVLDMASHVPVSRHGHAEYGLNMETFGVGDIKLAFTISVYASGDASAILYERLVPNLGLQGRAFA